jgi:hypothetical protein
VCGFAVLKRVGNSCDRLPGDQAKDIIFLAGLENRYSGGNKKTIKICKPKNCILVSL